MTSGTSRELAAKLYSLADGVGEANKKAVTQALMFAKEEFIAGGVAAGLRRGGALPSHGKARWGARFDEGAVTKGSGRSNYMGLVRYVGPVHWAFGGTGRHIIAARRLGSRRKAQQLAPRLGAMAAFGGSNRGAFGQSRRKGRGAYALTVPGASTPRAYAFHPGMRGRNTWPIVKNRVRRGAPRVFPEAYRGAMYRAKFGR